MSSGRRISLRGAGISRLSAADPQRLNYPIEKIVANFTNTFNVYMNVTGGTGLVDTGWCVASVSGQSMGASDAWDGKIEAQDFVKRFTFGSGSQGGRLKPCGIREDTMWKVDELMSRSVSDRMARSCIGGFRTQVDVR